MPGFATNLAETGVQRVWACDEGRFGLRVGLRRRWCPRGVRPPWLVHDRSEWLWLDAAVEPTTGESFFLLLPRVTKVCFARFLAAFAQETAGDRVGVVLDGSGAHRAAIAWPEGLAPLPMPRDSPERNPAEQIFRVLRRTGQSHLRESERTGGGTHRAAPALVGSSRYAAAADELRMVDRRRRNSAILTVKE